MASYVRGNRIICSGTFKASDGSATQPVSAELLLRYTDVNGDMAEDVLPMTLNTQTKIWSAGWDSRLTVGGVVEWVMRSVIGLQAAAQGRFVIRANSANDPDFD